jgi:hypothetical protein
MENQTFDPAYLRTAPGVPRSAPFPWHDVEQHLDGIAADVPDQCRADLGTALRRVMLFLLRQTDRGQLDAADIGRRTLALGYLLDPALVGNRSLRRIAREIKQSVSAVARDSAATRRTFKLRNAFSNHAVNFNAGGGA